MTEPNADFPTAATEPPSMYDSSHRATDYIMQQLAEKRAARGDVPLSPEQQEHKARSQRAADYHAAVKAETPDRFREAVRSQAADAGNIHALAHSDPVPATEPESDLDTESLATTLGFDSAAVREMKFENAGAASDQMKAGLNDLLSNVSDDELLTLVKQPGAVRFTADVERELDKLASKEFGYRGKRDETQQRNAELITLLCIRQLAATHKLGGQEPSLPALIARARLLNGDPDFRPGLRGHKPELTPPPDLFPNIHSALQQCPY